MEDRSRGIPFPAGGKSRTALHLGWDGMRLSLAPGRAREGQEGQVRPVPIMSAALETRRAAAKRPSGPPREHPAAGTPAGQEEPSALEPLCARALGPQSPLGRDGRSRRNST